MVARFAVGLWEEYRRPLIVPMTLVDAQYRDEIFTALRAADVPMPHVFLDVPADEVRRRIVAQEIIDGVPQSEDSRRFRLSNVDRCVAARDHLPPDTLVLDAHRHTPAELADRVLAGI